MNKRFLRSVIRGLIQVQPIPFLSKSVHALMGLTILAPDIQSDSFFVGLALAWLCTSRVVVSLVIAVIAFSAYVCVFSPVGV